ncbi:hypothetical protein Bhyg_07628, partial [Pseudolycoriella hygida]
MEVKSLHLRELTIAKHQHQHQSKPKRSITIQIIAMHVW